MKYLYHPSFDMRNLIVPTTLNKKLLIDLSRKGLHLRYGETTNQKSLTYEYLYHVHGPMYPLKRGKN
jgi:hypothetical protein